MNPNFPKRIAQVQLRVLGKTLRPPIPWKSKMHEAQFIYAGVVMAFSGSGLAQSKESNLDFRITGVAVFQSLNCLQCPLDFVPGSELPCVQRTHQTHACAASSPK